MSDYVKRIVARAETRSGAGTYTLVCGHQIAVSGKDWSSVKVLGVFARRSWPCHECERNDSHSKVGA